MIVVALLFPERQECDEFAVDAHLSIVDDFMMSIVQLSVGFNDVIYEIRNEQFECRGALRLRRHASRSARAAKVCWSVVAKPFYAVSVIFHQSMFVLFVRFAMNVDKHSVCQTCLIVLRSDQAFDSK